MDKINELYKIRVVHNSKHTTIIDKQIKYYYTRLLHLIEIYTHALKKSGIQPGHVIEVCSPRSTELFSIYFNISFFEIFSSSIKECFSFFLLKR